MNDSMLWARYQIYVNMMTGSDEYVNTYDEWLDS